MYSVTFKPGARLPGGVEPIDLVFGPAQKYRIDRSLLRGFGRRVVETIGDIAT